MQFFVDIIRIMFYKSRYHEYFMKRAGYQKMAIFGSPCEREIVAGHFNLKVEKRNEFEDEKRSKNDPCSTDPSTLM